MKITLPSVPDRTARIAALKALAPVRTAPQPRRWTLGARCKTLAEWKRRYA